MSRTFSNKKYDTESWNTKVLNLYNLTVLHKTLILLVKDALFEVSPLKFFIQEGITASKSEK